MLRSSRAEPVLNMYELLEAETGKTNISDEVNFRYFARQQGEGWLASVKLPFLKGSPEFVSQREGSTQNRAKRLAAQAALKVLRSRYPESAKAKASANQTARKSGARGANAKLDAVKASANQTGATAEPEVGAAKALANQTAQKSRARRTFAELEVGESLSGIVRGVAISKEGMMLAVNAESNAFLAWEEFGPWFPHELKKGLRVSLRILMKMQLKSGKTVVYVTQRKGDLARPEGYYETLNTNKFPLGMEDVSDFAGISREKWIDAEILRFYGLGKEFKRKPGVMVRLTAPGGSTPIHEFVHFGDLTREFKANSTVPGSSISLRVRRVNTTSRRIKLTMLPPSSSKAQGEAEEAPAEPAAVSAPVEVAAAPASASAAMVDEQWAGAMAANADSMPEEQKEEEVAPSTTTTTTPEPPEEKNSLMDALLR